MKLCTYGDEHINKMATDGGGRVVDGRHSDNCKHNIGPGMKSPPVSFVLYTVKMDFVQIHWSNSYKSPNSFIMGHLCCFRHCVTALSLSHVTVRHSKYLFKPPLLEAEDSSHMLLVPKLVSCCSLFLNRCHVVSDSALIILHLSSNSPQTDCCNFPSYHLSWVASSYTLAARGLEEPRNSQD